MWLHWGGQLEARILFLLDCALCAFSFADFNLYTFIVINHNHEYGYDLAFLNPVSPSSESWNMKVVLGNPKHFPIPFLSTI